MSSIYGDVMFHLLEKNYIVSAQIQHTITTPNLGLNIFYFIYMKRYWAKHRYYVETFSHTAFAIVRTQIFNHRTHSHNALTQVSPV